MQHTGRLAPTPSGRMHLGNLFASLLAWLSARAKNGRVVLRIEDLDPLRTGGAHTPLVLEDYRWLGLDWDEGPDTGGPHAPYTQSERGAFYTTCLERLGQKGLVYGCFCSRAELHAASAPHTGDGSYVYGRRCLRLADAERAALAAKRGAALRIQVPDDACISFTDGVQGPYSENLATECGDFILRRSDGIFAYQLCAPADDGAMGITEVVRGRDLLASTARQIWLLETLGFAPPQYYHVPLLLAPDGRRLAKRDQDLDTGALRTRLPKGPEPLVGWLAHSAGLLEKPEPAKAAELIPLFHWEKVKKNDITVGPLPF